MEVVSILAPNPGPYTGPGTNSYVLVSGDAALVIDPGPAMAAHLDRLRECLTGRRPVAVLATHHHFDHTESAADFAAEIGVETLGFGGSEFVPDRRLADEETVRCGDAELTVIHSPGHTTDSICLLSGGRLFAGDTVKGGSTVVVEDLAAYMATLERLIELEVDEIYPGHGSGPQASSVLDEYLAHRRMREQQVASAVRHGNVTIGDLIRAVYGELEPGLEPLAARSLQAHLDKLIAEGQISADLEWLGR